MQEGFPASFESKPPISTFRSQFRSRGLTRAFTGLRPEEAREKENRPTATSVQHFVMPQFFVEFMEWNHRRNSGTFRPIMVAPRAAIAAFSLQVDFSVFQFSFFRRSLPHQIENATPANTVAMRTMAKMECLVGSRSISMLSTSALIPAVTAKTGPIQFAFEFLR